MKEILIYSGIFLLAVDAMYNRLEIKDLKNEVNYLGHQQRLLKSQLKHLKNEVKYLGNEKRHVNDIKNSNIGKYNTKSAFVDLATFG